MRKLFTIETSSEKEWNEVLKSVQESLNDRHFMGFEISVACRIYNSNAFREWLDTLTAVCNIRDFYHCLECDSCLTNVKGNLTASKIIIFRKDYKDEEIEVVREQRNGYARRVEELEEALKEYEYAIVPELKKAIKEYSYDIIPELNRKCKNQAKEITYLHKKIEKLNDEAKALKEKQMEIVWDRDTVLKQLEKDKAELLERNKRLMNDNVLLKTMYDEISKDMDTSAWKLAINSVYGLTSVKFQNAFFNKDNADNIVAKYLEDPETADMLSTALKLAINTSSFIRNTNKKFNAVDAKLNDIADHLQELDKFRDSIKKEGDNKYD